MAHLDYWYPLEEELLKEVAEENPKKTVGDCKEKVTDKKVVKRNPKLHKNVKSLYRVG